MVLRLEDFFCFLKLEKMEIVKYKYQVKALYFQSPPYMNFFCILKHNKKEQATYLLL